MVLLVAYNNVALIIGINKYVKVDYKADLMETHDAIDNIEKKGIRRIWCKFNNSYGSNSNR